MNLSDKRALLDRIDRHLTIERRGSGARLSRAVLRTRHGLEGAQTARAARSALRITLSCHDLYATQDRARATVARSRSLLRDIAAERARRHTAGSA